MFCIAICDDEEVLCSQMEQLLQPYIKDSMVKTDVFYSGEALYKAMYEGAHYDLIFLDIEFQMMNGVDIGKKIRNELKDERVQIVYISAKQEYAMELFAVRPMNFLVKPLKKDMVENALEKAISLSEGYYGIFKFQIEQSHYQCFYGDILYFESKARKIIIHTKQGEHEFYGKLNRIEEVTDGKFLRVHQSYLINYLYIEHYRTDEITLLDKSKIPISKSYKKEVKVKLLENWSEI